MQLPIYLDHNSTTPVDGRVLDAMLPFFSENFGNPGSQTHSWGWRARSAVQQARDEVAALLGCDSKEVVFTSSATESNNLALAGLAAKLPDLIVLTTRLEHKSVLDPCALLQSKGHTLEFIETDSLGEIHWASLEKLLRRLKGKNVLISLMAANNEIGTLHDLQRIGRLCKEYQFYFHTDATQAPVYHPLKTKEWGVHLLTLSGHKMYGPKGVGCLYISQKNPAVPLQPLFCGGGQENGLRSGTLNVPGIVGLGKACVLAQQEQKSSFEKGASLRKAFWEELKSGIMGLEWNGNPEIRLANNLSLFFPGISAQSLMSANPEVAVSGGSACLSEGAQDSHVLRALGGDPQRLQSSIRFGLGKSTELADLKRVAQNFIKQYHYLKEGKTL